MKVDILTIKTKFFCFSVIEESTCPRILYIFCLTINTASTLKILKILRFLISSIFDIWSVFYFPSNLRYQSLNIFIFKYLKTEVFG